MTPLEERTAWKIAAAKSKDYIGEKLAKREKLLLVLSDYKWHTAIELTRSVSHRFGAYVFELRKEGLVVEMELIKERPKGEMWYKYRLSTKEEK